MLTTAHRADDKRIFHREALSLTKIGVEVHLISCLEPMSKKLYTGDVRLHILKGSEKLVFRITLNNLKVFIKALCLKGDIYHFHDPEFLPFGILLQFLTRKPVVFDAHEIYTSRFLFSVRRFFYKIYNVFQWLILPRLAGIIAPTPGGAEHYKKFSSRVHTFISFPPLNALKTSPPSYESKRVAYVGALSWSRGADLIPYIMEKVVKEIPDAKLVVAGGIVDKVGSDLMSKGYSWLEYKGRVPPEEIPHILRTCSVGWVFMRYTKNHSLAFPLKLGDYMAAGLPVVAGEDLEFTASIIRKARCGILAPSCEDINGQAKALIYLLSHPDIAKELGLNAQKAIRDEMNNDNEILKLKTFYKSLLNQFKFKNL
jgi:glycosyltransferase involved in cell wall biosynthesis